VGDVHPALTSNIIKLAIAVHRRLGPGLLENVCEECLCFEFGRNGLAFERQVPVPVVYDAVRLECGFRIDVLVERTVLIEIKAVERLLPVHNAQVLTYLKLTGCPVGLLVNFDAVTLKEGLRRFVRS
jgi:GxxExxY protein